MHWLIHNKFDHDPKVRELVNNLERFEIPYTRASVIPFSEDGIIFENETTTIKSLQGIPIYTYGSYTMCKIAKKYFYPASYISENLGMNHLLEHYGKEMLNHDMIIDSVKNIKPTDDMEFLFVRPVEDTKSICGTVWSKEIFLEWKNNIIKANKEFPNDYSTVTPNTIICISPIKYIKSEYRCFIVDGKVVTASQYKLNHKPYFQYHVDQYIIDYVNNVIADWKPDIAFVLDIALVDDKLSIIEANCINSSGLYEIDTQKLIMAIEQLSY